MPVHSAGVPKGCSGLANKAASETERLCHHNVQGGKVLVIGGYNLMRGKCGSDWDIVTDIERDLFVTIRHWIAMWGFPDLLCLIVSGRFLNDCKVGNGVLIRSNWP